MSDDENYGNQWTWTSTASTANVGYAVTWNTANVESEMKVQKDSKGAIHPVLYFKYLKKNFTLMQNKFLEDRLKRLEKMSEEFYRTGQTAMGDEAVRNFITLSKEAEMMAYGIKYYVTKEHAEKYQYRIKNSSLKITPLKNFSRIIPDKVAKIAKEIIAKHVFDGFVVFHVDDRGTSVKETEHERQERKKDPILFGTLEYSDKYYFIADWEDEVDDLTLDKMLKGLCMKRKDVDLAKAFKKETKVV